MWAWRGVLGLHFFFYVFIFVFISFVCLDWGFRDTHALFTSGWRLVRVDIPWWDEFDFRASE